MAGIVMFGKNSNEGPSPGLWGLAPRDIMYDPAVAYGCSKEFVNLPIFADGAEAVIANSGQWKGFGSTGAAAVSGRVMTGGGGGYYKLASDAENEGASISREITEFVLTRDAEEFFFEASVYVSATTTLDIGFFVGLVGVTALSAILPIEAAGDIGDMNLVGFHYPEADTTTFDTLYRANGVAEVDVGDGVGTIAAATWIKLGMHLKKALLRFFVNGMPLADTKTVPNATGTDFPADVALRPAIAMLHGSGVSGHMRARWLHAYQLRA
jgi:hypothetical protein